MEDDTKALILALQLEDLELLRSNGKGKSVEGGNVPDSQIAIDLQEAEARHQIALLTDFRMARSIDRAVQDDGAAVAILMADERRCAQDRGTACRMGGQHHEVPNTLNNSIVDDDVLSRLGSMNL